MVDVPDLEHFAAFCRTLTLDNGERMELQRFQRAMLADHFAGTQETLILLPKKNTKTTTIAALVLHHLCYVDDAEIYVAASSRDQATLLYNFAKRFVNRSPALQKRLLVRAGTREIRSRRDDGFLRVLAADADTADGVGPSLAIVDELHRHRSSALYDVFSDGLDARHGRMITISTAGSDLESPLGIMRTNALERANNPALDVELHDDGIYRIVRDPAAGFAMHEWALREGDDVDDLDLVLRANPHLTRAQLERRKALPSMTPSRWARFACNLWAQGDDAAISVDDWRPLKDTERPLVDGTENVVIGVDLGWTRDTTALVPVGILDDEDRVVDGTVFYGDDEDDLPDGDLPPVRVATIGVPVILPAPGDGTMTPDGLVKEKLRELAGRFPAARWVLDPNADGQHIAQWIEAELCGGDDERVIVHSQQPAPMCDASMGLAAQIRAGALRHPGDPDLDRQLLAAAAKWHGERWRLVQPAAPQRAGEKRRKPVDAAIATAMALRHLRAPQPEPLVPFAFSV